MHQPAAYAEQADQVETLTHHGIGCFCRRSANEISPVILVAL